MFARDATPDILRFGHVLRRFRRERALKQANLASIVGYQPEFISRLETGKRAPTTRALVVTLARALNLAPEEANELLAAAGFAPAWDSPQARLLDVSKRLDALESQVERMRGTLVDILDTLRQLERIRNEIVELRSGLAHGHRSRPRP